MSPFSESVSVFLRFLKGSSKGNPPNLFDVGVYVFVFWGGSSKDRI